MCQLRYVNPAIIGSLLAAGMGSAFAAGPPKTKAQMRKAD
jgi:hypothetical protein